MEGGSLFNPGFLGSSFYGGSGRLLTTPPGEIILIPGKYPNKNSIPGWGRRYKVRIIGLHDQGEDQIPSDQLPWANVMYPITAGGGQTGSKGTANLRQGNMVFGFFLDGQDQQVPVIMGILGNNSQTALNQKIGTSRVTNYNQELYLSLDTLTVRNLKKEVQEKFHPIMIRELNNQQKNQHQPTTQDA
jgi:hypothetical protein